MKTFKLKCQTTFFKCWLAAIICQSGYGLSEEYTPFNQTEYSYSTNHPLFNQNDHALDYSNKYSTNSSSFNPNVSVYADPVRENLNSEPRSWDSSQQHSYPDSDYFNHPNAQSNFYFDRQRDGFQTDIKIEQPQNAHYQETNYSQSPSLYSNIPQLDNSNQNFYSESPHVYSNIPQLEQLNSDPQGDVPLPMWHMQEEYPSFQQPEPQHPYEYCDPRSTSLYTEQNWSIDESGQRSHLDYSQDSHYPANTPHEAGYYVPQQFSIRPDDSPVEHTTNIPRSNPLPSHEQQPIDNRAPVPNQVNEAPTPPALLPSNPTIIHPGSLTSENDLKQAKSSAKVIKKMEDEKRGKIAETIGKKDLAIPSVGFVEQPFQANATIAEEDLQPLETAKKKVTSQASSKQSANKQKEAIASHSKVKTPSPSVIHSLVAQIDENLSPQPSNLPNPVEIPVPTQSSLPNNLPSSTAPLTPPQTPTSIQTQTPIPNSTPAPANFPPQFIPRTIPEAAPAATTIITPSTTEIPLAPESTPVPVATSLPKEIGGSPQLKEISVNFNNVSIIEYIRFFSRISNKNFIFNDDDLQFNVTIVSEEPTSIENLMAALLQELRIRDLSLIEQGNNIIIHRNSRIRAPAHIVADGIPEVPTKETELVTRVFRLNTLDPIKAGEIIRPLLSEEALVEILRDTNNIIITDLVANVNKIAQLINSLDAPNSGMVIGQYAVHNTFVDSLAALADRILQPIAQGNPYVLIPHPATNSIYVVSNAFIVEKALAILENLDLNEGRTQIMTLERLRLMNQGRPGAGGFNGNANSMNGANGLNGANGGAGVGFGGIGTGLGGPGVPLGPDGLPIQAGIGAGGVGGGFIDERLLPGEISTNPRWTQELPPGHIERTLFFIHKLKYRRGDQIEIALRKIADSLVLTGTTNADLISAINSIQWLESSNSLIFTGTALALDKIHELIEEIDIPLRQVFIEMLILDTSITDSLTYSVDWGTRFGGGNTAGAEAFLSSTSSPLITALDGASIASPPTAVTAGPSPNLLARSAGFSLGVVGRHLSHGGTLFNSIGALVNAIHDDAKVNIIMNPKIITEDNNTAEIFVGSTDRFKTQSISNDLGSVITNNFQFIDVGTTLRVTPLIGNNDVITLDIVEEITNDTGNANPISNAANVDVNIIPVLSKTRTLTRIHVPNGFFVILSGMIQDTRARAISQIPCLGGIPIIGGISKQKRNQDSKRNLMIFIRPIIVDSDDEIENITKRQQDIYREKTKFRRSWNYEIDEALDFINLKKTDPDEIGCTVK